MFETRNFSNKNNRGRRQVCVHLERICNVFNRRSRYLHSEIGFSKVGTRFPVLYHGLMADKSFGWKDVERKNAISGEKNCLGF